MGSSKISEDRISVIVPTYFRCSELDALLFPSLLAQSLLPAETIVVDDTPNDSVKQICKKWHNAFAQSNIELIYAENPFRRSSTTARNFGVSLSHGRFIAFFDSDLRLDRAYLQNVLNIFSADPKAVGVQGHVTNSGGNRRVMSALRLFRSIEGARYSFVSTFLRNFAGFTMPSVNSCRTFEYPLILDRVITCEWLIGSNFVVEKNVFDHIEFDETLAGYALGDDILFSNELKPLGALYITPLAQCEHYESPSGRASESELSLKEKYYLNRLFGLRGTAIYYNKRILFGILRFLRLL